MARRKTFIIIVFVNILCFSVTGQRKTPIMGWSSWNTYRIDISDSLIRKQADFMISTGLKDAGYEYVNIDDGYFGYRDSLGNMKSHPIRFPNGMKSVADYIHSLGLKAGLYSDAGYVTCGSIWDNDSNGIGAGLYGHELQDALLYFNDWGFDFIKIDYCGAGQELDLDEKERYTFIRHAIDRCGRKDIELNICRWAFPGTWAADIASSWRISPDITDSWQSIKQIVEKNIPLSAYSRNHSFNDMDMLEIGRSLSESEERVHFGLWCMMSSPLLIGCDLSSINDKSLSLLKNRDLIALNQDSLGKQAYPVRYDNGTWVLAKDIIKERGNKRAVALYNPTDSVRCISVSLKDLELGGKAMLRNLFTGEKIVLEKTFISEEVPPHDVVIFNVEAEKRIEPVRYEAEWAYLPMYNELGKHKKEVKYVKNPNASGGLVVKNAGGQTGNSIIWNNVYSTEGGQYNLSVFYIPEDRRGIEIIINGEPLNFSQALEHSGEIAILKIPVELKKGANEITLTCGNMWLPDIDKIELYKL